MIVDLACNIYVLDYTAYQQLVPTTNRTTQCTPTFVARLGVAPGTTCTGLSSGLRSNVSVPVTAHHTHNTYAVHQSSALAAMCSCCFQGDGLHAWQANGGAVAAPPLTDILLSLGVSNIFPSPLACAEIFTSVHACCRLVQHLLLSTNQGEVVVMEVEARPDGTFGSTVRSQVDVALDPLSGKQGSSGGACASW